MAVGVKMRINRLWLGICASVLICLFETGCSSVESSCKNEGKKKMEFIAHRGESMIAPENTLESFNLAWVRGDSGIEGDFHLTKDGYVVCMHDGNAKRTGGVDRKLSEMTLAEIRQLDVGAYKGKEWRGTRVPTLEEVMETIPPSGKIFIELKCAEGIVDKLKEIFSRSSLMDKQLVIISFDPETIRQVKAKLPEYKALLLLSIGIDEATGKPLMDAGVMIKRLKEVNADGVDCCAHDFIDRDWVSRVKSAGFEFHVWTVDDVKTAKKFIDYGVDSITSNCAYVLRQEIK